MQFTSHAKPQTVALPVLRDPVSTVLMEPAFVSASQYMLHDGWGCRLKRISAQLLQGKTLFVKSCLICPNSAMDMSKHAAASLWFLLRVDMNPVKEATGR